LGQPKEPFDGVNITQQTGRFRDRETAKSWGCLSTRTGLQMQDLPILAMIGIQKTAALAGFWTEDGGGVNW
jgi:hypothetical protein